MHFGGRWTLKVGVSEIARYLPSNSSYSFQPCSVRFQTMVRKRYRTAPASTLKHGERWNGVLWETVYEKRVKLGDRVTPIRNEMETPALRDRRSARENGTQWSMGSGIPSNGRTVDGGIGGSKMGKRMLRSRQVTPVKIMLRPSGFRF